LLESRLYPVVVMPSTVVRSFAPTSWLTERRYGLGDRTTRWVPAVGATSNGREATFGIINGDAVGRLTALGQLAFGSGDAWRGGALDVVWRGWRPVARIAGFTAATSTPLFDPFTAGLRATALDRLSGGRARIDYIHSLDRADIRLAVGGSLSRLTTRDQDALTISRDLAFGEFAASVRQSGGAGSASESVVGHVTGGKTGGGQYERFLVSAAAHLAVRGFPALDAGGSYGRVSTTAPAFEQFVVGGLPPNLIDASILTQRLSMSALPPGVAGGDRVLTYRVATSLAGVAPYVYAASAGFATNRYGDWHRVMGLEMTVDQSTVPVLGLPGARLVAGIGYSLDAPVRRQRRGYFATTLRP
jgi:hypothetical protein